MKIKQLQHILLIFLLFMLSILMFYYPDSTWQSGIRGLAIWWDVLFPSLFPFFVISEMMLGFGIVHFLGTLLDPLMRPLFRIPGSGGFIVAMGLASGYPMSAKLTTKLRKDNLITRSQGERLVSFTTSSDPIFLIGAVSVGFFGNAKLALTLALAHYGSAMLLGIILRFTAPKQETLASQTEVTNKISFKQAFSSMHKARLQDGRSIGLLLQQAVTSSLQLMTVVGGLVLFFSVILEIFTVSGIMNYLAHGLEWILALFHLPPQLGESLIGGLFEVTLGAKSAATAQVSPMLQAAIAAFILSWGGLSVHAQVASILNESDLRYTPFLLARLLHAFLAALMVTLLWRFTMGSNSSFINWGIPVLSPSEYLSKWSIFTTSLSWFVSIIGVFLTFLLLILPFRFFKKK
jgi:sporulation integral membrane protein YlbJ